MKKYLIIIGVAILAFLGGCGLNVSVSPSISPKPVVADETSKFEYLGQTNKDFNNIPCNLYRYVDEEKGKIVYMYGDVYGRGVAVTDIKNR